MKDLVSQDYIDYQDGRDHFRYFGQPVDPLGKDSQNYLTHAKSLNPTHAKYMRRLNLKCFTNAILECQGPKSASFTGPGRNKLTFKDFNRPKLGPTRTDWSADCVVRGTLR